MTGPRSRLARHKTKKLRNVKKERRPSGAARSDPCTDERDHAGEIEAFVRARPPEQQAALRALQQLVARTAPQAEHKMRWMCPSWVGHGDICYMSAHKDHVNLGFYRGAELADPHGLLEGTGKGLRHVKLPLNEPLPAAKLQTLIREAIALETYRP